MHLTVYCSRIIVVYEHGNVFSKIHAACHNIANVIKLIKLSVLPRDVNVGLNRFHYCLYSCADPAGDSHLENHKVSLQKLVRVPLE